MKIAIVANPYYPVPPTKYGGTEWVVHYLIKGLLEMGHEPILLGTGDSKVSCELVSIIDKSIPFPRKSTAEFRQTIRRSLAKTNTELRKIAPRVDIIHSMDFDLKNFTKYPNVTTIHGHIGFENLPFFQARRELAYVSISKNQQAAFPGLNYVEVAYNGLDPADFPIVPVPDNYLCFLGRFDWDKSPHLAIQLAISLKMPIKIAGKIDYDGVKYFKEQIKPYLNHPLVEFLGELSFPEKVALVSNAKCNLHPLLTRREPFGLTVIESAYCGTPTLAMRRGSMPELIEDGKTGVLVEDFVEGSHKIEKCFSMDRKYIAERARLKFNYVNMTKDYLKAYKKVLKACPK